MATQNDIDENKTTTLKKGDKVIMQNCEEASYEKYQGKQWICLTDSYLDKSKQEVVFLEDFSGCFLVEYLRVI